MAGSALAGRRIALGVGGGIAAYKVCELVRELIRAGAHVRVSMTEGARQFVTPLTFQSLTRNPVLTDYFDAHQEAAFGHIELARWAELFIVAPATADLLARLRAGMASDPVTTTLSAYRGTVLLAPAMNSAMWENSRTQDNLKSLLEDPRFRSLGTAPGELACGEVGEGRLVETTRIAAAAAEAFEKGPLEGLHILVTAGPTRERLDPVRFISNPSSGKMGYAMAEAAMARGGRVTLISGPTALEPPRGSRFIRVESAQEMADAVLGRLNEDRIDVLVAAAAVSDWRPVTTYAQKQKKESTSERQAVELVRTPDILGEVARRLEGDTRTRPRLVGFAAETEAVAEHAREKRMRKRLDWIVANDVSASGVGRDAGFEADRNRVLLIGSTQEVPIEGTKRQVADAIWDRIADGLL